MSVLSLCRFTFHCTIWNWSPSNCRAFIIRSGSCARGVEMEYKLLCSHVVWNFLLWCILQIFMLPLFNVGQVNKSTIHSFSAPARKLLRDVPNSSTPKRWEKNIREGPGKEAKLKRESMYTVQVTNKGKLSGWWEMCMHYKDKKGFAKGIVKLVDHL